MNPNGKRVIALNPRYQAGVDFFQKRDVMWLYLGAPEGVKRYYEVGFYEASPAYHDSEEERVQTKNDIIAIYRSLTDKDWDYIINHEHWGVAKWGLRNVREKYSNE